ncbi:MAG: protein kinase [Planctomycetota bacterium]|nr:protein kinase [Planctomycetota bacterium]
MPISRETNTVAFALQQRMINANQADVVTHELAQTSNASASAVMLARGFITEAQHRQLLMVATQARQAGTQAPETGYIDPDETGVLPPVAEAPSETMFDPANATGEFPGLAAAAPNTAPHVDLEGTIPGLPDTKPARTTQPQTPPHRAAGRSTREPENRWDQLSADPEQRYEWEKEFARGGLGAVWLVRDRNLDRQVAVKELLPNGLRSKSMVQRFLAEAQVTGQLEHPGIVPVYDVGVKPNGCPFYSMKLLEGNTLSDVIAGFHALTQHDPVRGVEFNRLLNIFVDVCQALEYAHQHRVLHRDLKPLNVMVGGFGEAILVDWGLAKVMDRNENASASTADSDDAETALLSSAIRASVSSQPNQTMSGTVLGTPAYMSPEQARGELADLDQRADIYSMGAILYEILTGRAPIQGKDLDDLLTAAVASRYEEPRAVDRNIPAALNAVCLKALAAQPDDRYQSARELGEEVNRWLAGEPVTAWPEPWWTRAERWVKQHKSLVASVAVALLAITLISIAATVLVDQSRRAEQEARVLERDAKIAATNSLRVAQDSVDEWLIDVSHSMQWFPELDQTRRQLLYSAATHYRHFADRPADDLPLKIEVAKANIRLGDTTRLLGEWDQSQAAFEKAVDQFETLALETPENLQVRLQLANSRTGLAMLLSQTGRNTEAEATYAEAGKMLKSLTEQSDDAAMRDAYGRSQNSHARLLAKLGRPRDAEVLLRDAIEQFANAAEGEDRLRFHRRLLAARLDLGHVLSDQGKYTESSDIFRVAIQAYDKLLLDDPRQPELLQGRASARVSLANSLRTRADKTVVDAYESAIRAYTSIVEQQPRVMGYRENLVIAQLNFAQFLLTVDRPLDAKTTAIAALEGQLVLVNYDADVPRYHAVEATIRQTLGEILVDLADHETATNAFQGAIQKFAELTNVFPDILDYRVRLAECQTSLGRLLTTLDRKPEARKLLDDAALLFEESLKRDADNLAARFGQASHRVADARLHLAAGDQDAARQRFQQAIELFEKLPDDPAFRFEFAWLLVDCELTDFRNAERSIEIASQLTQRFPTNADYWNLLGLAYARADRWDESVQAIETAKTHRMSNDGADSFVLAMNQTRQNATAQARALHESGDKEMQQTRPGNRRLIRLRDASKPQRE